MSDGHAPVASDRLGTTEALSAICGEVAGAFRHTWGRGPVKTNAHWAGPNMLVVLLENGHTAAEKTMRAAGHIQQLLDGRQLLQTTLEGPLMAIVEAATGRRVITVLSATRLDPDLSAEIFLLEDGHGPDEPEIATRAAEAAIARARELGDQSLAVQAEAQQAQRRTRTRRASKP